MRDLNADAEFVREMDRRRRTDSSDAMLARLRPVTTSAPPEFESYLRRMADHRVLTRAQERRLAEIVRAADDDGRDEERELVAAEVDARHEGGAHTDRIAAATGLDPDVVRELRADLPRWRRQREVSRRAKEQLLLHNMRLVVSVCRNYAGLDYDFQDLVQEGVKGLNRAIEKFEPELGNKLGTYATWWIRQSLQRYMLTHGNTIRVPGHLQEAKRKVTARLRVRPDETVEEACRAVEVPYKDFVDAVDGPRVVSSLDASVGDGEDDDGRHSLIPDEHATDPLEEVIERGGPRSAVGRAVEALPDLQRRVIELRYGLRSGDRPPGPVRGRDAVAEELGISPQAVKQAQREGLARLRAALGAGADAFDALEAAAGLDEPVAATCRREPV